MVTLHRLNQQPVVVNALALMTLESTPDTLLTLVNGEKLLVRESAADVVAAAVAYLRSLAIGPARLPPASVPQADT